MTLDDILLAILKIARTAVLVLLAAAIVTSIVSEVKRRPWVNRGTRK